MKNIKLILIFGIFSITIFVEGDSELDTVQKKYRAKIESAQKKYRDSIDKIRKQMIAEYKKILNKAMAKKDLESANQYNEKIEKLESGENFFNIDFSLIGVWNVIYDNKSTRKYLIDSDMDITVLESNYPGKGNKAKLQRYKDGWIASFAGETEYIFLKGKKIGVLYWPTNLDYKKDKPSFSAEGTRDK